MSHLSKWNSLTGFSPQSKKESEYDGLLLFGSKVNKNYKSVGETSDMKSKTKHQKWVLVAAIISALIGSALAVDLCGYDCIDQTHVDGSCTSSLLNNRCFFRTISICYSAVIEKIPWVADQIRMRAELLRSTNLAVTAKGKWVGEKEAARRLRVALAFQLRRAFA